MDSQTTGPSTPMTGGVPPNPAAMPAPPAPQQAPPRKHKKSKKAVWSIVVILVLLGAGAAGYYYYSNHYKKTTTTTTVAPDNTSAVKPQTLTNTIVEITDKGVNPKVVQIKAGTQVTWHNSDNTQHRITADPYPSKSSLPELDSQDNLAAGASFGFIFEKSGTYTYNDYLNPTNKSFQGTVIVQ